MIISEIFCSEDKVDKYQMTILFLLSKTFWYRLISQGKIMQLKQVHHY